MKIRNTGLMLMAAAMALVGTMGVARAADEAPKKNKPAARGKVSKLDTTAKTFVVTSKKAGEFTVSYSDQTKFMKAPAVMGEKPTDAAVADLKDGVNVAVRGTLEGTKVTAKQITIGAKRKKKPAAQ